MPGPSRTCSGVTGARSCAPRAVAEYVRVPMAATIYPRQDWPVRADLDAAHDRWLDHVAAAGTWWSGAERVAFVAALWDALDHPSALAPWDSPAAPAGSPLPDAAFAMAHRLGRGAGTTSRSWYERTVAALPGGPPAFVELAALAAAGCAVAAFGPALGLSRPALRPPLAGEPSQVVPVLVETTMNWVPVTPPADERPPVVQAFTAVPAEYDAVWALAAAQYLPLDEMVQLDWQRPGSPLQRRQLELVAARLSLVRECFY